MRQVRRWIAAVLLLAGALSACLPAGGQSAPVVETPTYQPTPTHTPTIVWFPPTPTRTPLPAQQILPTPTPQLGKDEILLEDDFSAREGWMTSRTTAGSIAYGVDELTLAVASRRAYLVSLRRTPAFGDFFLEMTARVSLCQAEDQYGLLLRAADEWNYYRWVITCDGRSRLERVQQGAFVIVQDWVESPRIQAGALAENRLGVWMFGREMRFFVNDLELFAARDPVWSEGALGVFVRAAGEPPLTVSFDNLQVWSLDRTQIPTSTPVPPAP
uniref:DUF1080 domain-containing protein n=1 Tax=Bellilinea caldifistulae TaxID=360411 RepID=A0A7C4L0Q7_9CHLR